MGRKLAAEIIIIFTLGIGVPAPTLATSHCLKLINFVFSPSKEVPPSIRDGFFSPIADGQERGMLRRFTQGVPVILSQKYIGKPFEFTPFRGIKNIADNLVFSGTSRIGRGRVTGPIIRGPYNFLAGIVAFSIWTSPIYGVISVGGELKLSHDIELNAPYYDRLIDNDPRFERFKYLKSAVDGKTLRRKAFDDRKFFEALYQYYFDLKGDLNQPILVQNGRQLVPKKLLLDGVTKAEGYLVPDERAGEIFEKQFDEIAKIQVELSVKIEAATLLISPEQSVFDKNAAEQLVKFKPVTDALMTDSYFQKIHGYYVRKEITREEFLGIIIEDLQWQANFKQNAVLGIVRLQKVQESDGTVHFTDKHLTLEDLRGQN